MKNALIFIFLFLSLHVKGQLSPEEISTVDSLKKVIASDVHDSLKVNAFENWDALIYRFDLELDMTILEKIDSVCHLNLNRELSVKERNFYLSKQGRALYNLGNLMSSQGNFDEAISYFDQSLVLFEEASDQLGIAQNLTNSGLVHVHRGDYSKAQENYETAILIFKELNAMRGLSNALNNLAIVYINIGDYEKGIENFTNCLNIYEELGERNLVGSTYTNIGNVHRDMGNLDKALEYYDLGLSIKKEMNDIEGQSIALGNIGSIYLAEGSLDSSEWYFSQSLEIAEGISHDFRISEALLGLGNTYIEKNDFENASLCFERAKRISLDADNRFVEAASLSGLAKVQAEIQNYRSAIFYGNQALRNAQEIGALSLTKTISKYLYEWNKKVGNIATALDMYELYITSRDSIQSEQNQREVLNQEFQYKYEKQKALDEAEFEKQTLLEKQRTDNLIAIEREREKKQNVIIYGIMTGLILVIGFLIFAFNRLNLTKRQKNEITEKNLILDQQHRELEETHKEITDSIDYARHLQAAILPSFDEISNKLGEHFILFQPKGVVSGDFYWFADTENVKYIAAADCTGHGVPGAMLCVVCSNALNRSVNEFGITEPSKILDKTREIVIETLGKKGDHIKDGMDIALGALHSNKVVFSGANNPLWIIRKKALLSGDQLEARGTIVLNELALIEYKGNKQPIGLFHKMNPFHQENVKLFSGDQLYFFSDGYIDQFGGEKGKKFKTRPFKELLLQGAHLTMDQQKITLSETFKHWKRDFDQIDDVCVIGLKIGEIN